MLSKSDKSVGLLYNFTGKGKGKTTGALGTVIRALGWHWKVAVLQFMKSDRATGERQFFKEHLPEVLFQECGLGRSIKVGDHKAFAQDGWKIATDLLQNFDGDLLVLDEINIALSHGHLDLDEVLEALKQRRKSLNVIVTGRYSPQAMLDISDLVSEINAVKHPYQQGIPARKGLDY